MFVYGRVVSVPFRGVRWSFSVTFPVLATHTHPQVVRRKSNSWGNGNIEVPETTFNFSQTFSFCYTSPSSSRVLSTLYGTSVRRSFIRRKDGLTVAIPSPLAREETHKWTVAWRVWAVRTGTRMTSWRSVDNESNFPLVVTAGWEGWSIQQSWVTLLTWKKGLSVFLSLGAIGDLQDIFWKKWEMGKTMRWKILKIYQSILFNRFQHLKRH